jgi:hypothetical protein
MAICEVELQSTSRLALNPRQPSRSSMRATRSPYEDVLEAENAALRDLLTQAGINSARLLAQAGVAAAESEIGPGAVLPFAMLVNELCTNAAKYGALSDTGMTGCPVVLIKWRCRRKNFVSKPTSASAAARHNRAARYRRGNFQGSELAR